MSKKKAGDVTCFFYRFDFPGHFDFYLDAMTNMFKTNKGF